MKRQDKSRLIIVCSSLILLNSLAALGQSSGGPFTITSHVAAGGGCGPDGSGGCIPSIGSGNLVVDGTVAEPGATDLAREPPFSLRSGFWYATLANTPTAANGTITGRIVDNNGAPVEGAVVRLSGTQNRKFITDANGFYRFDNVETNGFYSVTPSRANYTFNPSARSFSQLGQTTEAAFGATLNNTSFVNPLDTPEYFVRQHYLDFLGREPDEPGFNFWVNNIESCGADADCRAVKLIHTSAAFFLSLEFQQTGFMVHRIYQSAYGDLPGTPVPLTRSEFGPDTARLSNGVVVLKTGWESVLENNKQGHTAEFVQRARFTSAFPATLTPSEFVDRLFSTAGIAPVDSDRAAVIAEFGSASTSADTGARSRALRRVAENSALEAMEFNQAFVLMQYFGYLRRDANSGADSDFSGYNYWLNKLDSFNGNFADAEMVKAFLNAVEYRQRFPK